MILVLPNNAATCGIFVAQVGCSPSSFANSRKVMVDLIGVSLLFPTIFFHQKPQCLATPLLV